MCKKDHALYPATCTWVNDKYSGGITDSLLIICDKVIEETKKVPQQELFWQKALQQKVFQQKVLHQIFIFYWPFYSLP